MKIFGIALFVAAFVLFSQAVGPLPSAYQAEFDDWALAEEQRIAEILTDIGVDPSVDKIMGDPSSRLKLPLLSVTLSKSATRVDTEAAVGSNQVFSLGQGQSPDEGKKILRLLALMREAQIFAMSGAAALKAENAPARDDTEALVGSMARIVVTADQKSFASKFFESEARSNTKILTLLRLFREYGQDSSAQEPAQ